MLGNGVASGTVGGTASYLSGGKFEDGFRNGAYGRLFNDMAGHAVNAAYKAGVARAWLRMTTWMGVSDDGTQVRPDATTGRMAGAVLTGGGIVFGGAGLLTGGVALSVTGAAFGIAGDAVSPEYGSPPWKYAGDAGAFYADRMNYPAVGTVGSAALLGYEMYDFAKTTSGFSK